MHEVALMQSAVELVLEHARRANAARVRVVTLRIGELSGACPDALSMAFDVITEGTIAEGARLDTVEQRARYCCRVCEAEFEPTAGFWICPACRSKDVVLKNGLELDLVSLEVEQ